MKKCNQQWKHKKNSDEKQWQKALRGSPEKENRSFYVLLLRELKKEWVSLNNFLSIMKVNKK